MNHEIYKQLLGDNWRSLAEPIRLAHETGVEHTGIFRISHSGHFLARLILACSKLPRRAAATPTRLKITRQNQIEIWERWFGEDQFTTRQWASPAGLLVERFGVWELHFALHTDAPDLLRYVQRRARIHLGPFSCPVPLICAPSVSATETAGSATEVGIQVEVSLPAVGKLIAYDGYLNVNRKTA